MPTQVQFKVFMSYDGEVHTLANDAFADVVDRQELDWGVGINYGGFFVDGRGILPYPVLDEDGCVFVRDEDVLDDN